MGGRYPKGGGRVSGGIYSTPGTTKGGGTHSAGKFPCFIMPTLCIRHFNSNLFQVLG